MTMQISLSDFLVRAQRLSGVRIKYVHPTLFVIHVSEVYEGKEELERTANFLESSGMRADELESFRASPVVDLQLLTPVEWDRDFSFIDSADAGAHWLTAFLPEKNVAPVAMQTGVDRSKGPRAIHFYGYKGGQARSTVLVAMAKHLADDGRRVLVVDADLEAPSLDIMFSVAATGTSSTLMGQFASKGPIEPLEKVYVGSSGKGQVDLLACRPSSKDFDLDFAAFLLSASLDPKALSISVSALRDFSSARGDEKGAYDLVLFDHRTGLAPSVMPILAAWPGSSVIFVRPDEMARHIYESNLLDHLLGQDEESPGAFVSFPLDPKVTASVVRQAHGRFVERLLEKVSDALATDDHDDIDPSELERYWVMWRQDPAFFSGNQPAPAEMMPDNREALAQLAGVLGLDSEVSTEDSPSPVLTSSGASDQGMFILTPDVAKIFSKESPYAYIFGRKGTGKTRLLTELVRRGLGEPLLVASDFTDGGLPSGGTVFSQLLSAKNNQFEDFWWSVLLAALEMDVSAAQNLSFRIEELCADKDFLSLSLSEVISQVKRRVLGLTSKRVFLIDGVETAVPAAQLRAFVEALFRFLSAVQYEREFVGRIVVRLFLRSDLRGAIQNSEQQVEGRSIRLQWDKTSILNFALARILSLSWFRRAFPTVVDRIEKRAEDISRGALPDSEAETLLLEIFPSGLERNKIKTTTFFATYFSDAGGDSDRNASFYPRLFDAFLRRIQVKCDTIGASDLPGDRVPGNVVLEAYDEASADFLNEVKTELYSFLEFDADDSANRASVDQFISAFIGLSTPFSLDDLVSELKGRTSFSPEVIRSALRSMKEIGVFEDRPGYPGEWRTGRLYKSSLRMKYVRKKSNT